MTNLFSTFDPVCSIFYIKFRWNWLICLLPCILFPLKFWLCPTQYTSFFLNLFLTLSSELKAVFGPFIFPGILPWTMSYFFFIIFSNTIGLLPYVFTSTRHLSITLTLSLPFWLGTIVYSAIFQYNHLFSHLVPLGTPAPLIPIIVLIETVRNIIRPGTLAVRLAANIVAGHLLLSLLGGKGETLRGIILLGLIRGLILLIILECAVACIQAYVFCILNSLYLNELISVSFNKTTN